MSALSKHHGLKKILDKHCSEVQNDASEVFALYRSY